LVSFIKKQSISHVFFTLRPSSVYLGNKVYRTVINDHKTDYQHAAKIVKPRVARRIVHAIRHSNPPSRFLKKDATDNLWRDVGDKAASEKTSQALREKSSEEKKACAKANKREDTVPAGYSMPDLAQLDGAFVITPAAQLSVLSPDAEVEHDGNGLLYSDIVNPDGPEAQPLVAYPVEGGTFGAVNAEGHIVITDQDILCGRGGATNHHKGNKRFRDIVTLHRPDYVAAPKIRKPDVARKIVRAIRTGNQPGRFLKKADDGKWVDIGDKKAAEKASQALREKGPEVRKLQKVSGINGAATIVVGDEETGGTPEVQHYPTFPDVGADIHSDSQDLALGLNSDSPTADEQTEAKEDLLPDIAAGLVEDDKRHAELDIVSPDPKRLRAEEPIDEYHV